MKISTLVLTALALVGSLLAARPAQAAYQVYISINGAKQGVFPGESPRDNKTGQIPVLKYDYEIKSPRDLASGQASGKRQHSPITFQKEWGAATVHIYEALVTNENLKNVTFTFWSTNADGLETVDFKVVLTNAHVIDIHQHVGDTRHDDTLNPQRLEDVSLIYQTIAIQDGTSLTGDGPLTAGTAAGPARLAHGKTPAPRRTTVAALLPTDRRR